MDLFLLSSEKKPISKCVEIFFEESKIDGTTSECCNADVISFSEITHSPRFIFIYLFRSASNLPGSKNNTFIEFDNYINIPTVNGNVLYKLRSVIDHLDGNESGHYFVKTLSGSDWYLLNDVQVKIINPTDVPTKHSIGLLIEKVTNFDENIPEPLINYDIKCFYRSGFQSILEIFYQCCPIRQYFIDLYMDNSTKKNKTKSFIENLGQFFHYMRNMNEQEIENGVENLFESLENSIDKNDLHKCFIQILSKINEETKLPQNNYSEFDSKTNISADDQFLVYKSKNNGLFFDNFFGQVSYETKCNNKECNTVFNKKYQLFSSLPLQIQSVKQNTPLSECIEKHFANSKVEGANYKCCNKQEIISICQFTHSPQFIFIYLVRGNYSNIFIEFDNYINIPTVNGNVLYKLRSVIDRCNYNTSGEYLVKMLIKSNWWLKKDYRMKRVSPSAVPTNFSVGLLFEKVTNINHNIPEPLLIDKYNSNYQHTFESIVKFLYLCCDIRKHLIDFYTNTNTSENITENLIFKRKIGEIMVLLEKTETADIQILKETLNFLSTKIENIDQLYCCILDKLNDQTTNINEDTKQQSAMSEPDLFGDHISIDLKCRLCEKIFRQGITTFKLMTIQEPTSNQKATIDECIERFLENSENNECSDKQQIISTNQLTNLPQFIFIYLVRKFNNVIEFNNYINVATENGNYLYKLRYVIDQIGGNEYKNYVVKTLSDSKWLRKSDYEVKEIKPTDVPTKYSIGLFIERVTNINQNVPESLLSYHYRYQDLLQSILQILYLCLDISKNLINFYTNYNLNENITENLIFKKKIGEVMYFLEHENEPDRINKLLAEASNFLPNKIMEIEELYVCVMNKLNEKEIYINSNLECNDSMDESGYKCSRIHCENCKKYFNEICRPQIFRSFYLKSENNELNLSKRIENFCKSQLDASIDIERCCNHRKLLIVDEILSSPKYLFICFDGIEGNIENIEEIILNTQSGGRHYFLQSLLNYSTIQYSNGQTKEKFSVTKFDSNSFPKSKNLSVSIIAVMMVRADEYHPINNSERHDQEEKLESYFIAESIKQIIELNKENKIYALFGLLFSCTPFRNFVINLNRNNEIKKVFEKFALIESGKIFKNFCNLFDRVIERKTISTFIKSDNNWSIHQCFNYIFGNIKLITESKEFSEILKSDNHLNSNFISDNFYGKFLLEVFCINCSNKNKSEDSFSNLCVKIPHKELSIDLEKCLIHHFFEKEYQQEEKCCENAEFVSTRKIIHSPRFLFICVDEQTRNNNPNCILSFDSILTIDTTAGQVTYSLISLVDQIARNMYDIKFLGDSGWLQIFPRPRKINNSELFTKFAVGFLFKKLE